MLYPLYDYYMQSDLSLEEVASHFMENFYLKKYGFDKTAKISKKIGNSSKIAAIYGESIQRRAVPDAIVFGSAINEMMYFIFQSNETQALAVLLAGCFWKKEVNDVYKITSDEDIKLKILSIFKKYQILEEMTEDQFYWRDKL